jgi:hypothetical protein
VREVQEPQEAQLAHPRDRLDGVVSQSQLQEEWVRACQVMTRHGRNPVVVESGLAQERPDPASAVDPGVTRAALRHLEVQHFSELVVGGVQREQKWDMLQRRQRLELVVAARQMLPSVGSSVSGSIRA